MPEAPDILKPLKTWSHLAGRRKRPSEYEIVTTNLHYSMNATRPPFELDPDMPMNRWYAKYRNGSRLAHPDWDEFRDPEEIVYRTYNMMQDGQETYVENLLNEFATRDHDAGFDGDWVRTLARLYTPGRFLFHTVQMASAYLGQMAPASTISNCAFFQVADALRAVSHTAYRTRELANRYPTAGFAQKERDHWENDAAWQGFRELMERLLATYDWGEAFVALQLVAKPAIDECLLRSLGNAGRANGDTLLGMLSDAQLRDSDRSRRWTAALVAHALQNVPNRAVIAEFVDKWRPLGVRAAEVYCAGLPEGNEAGAKVTQAVGAFHASLML